MLMRLAAAPSRGPSALWHTGTTHPRIPGSLAPGSLANLTTRIDWLLSAAFRGKEECVKLPRVIQLLGEGPEELLTAPDQGLLLRFAAHDGDHRALDLA